MNRLFTYGCSFTNGNGCFSYEPYYKKYKKSKSDKIWPKTVAEEFDLELKNYSLCRNSNDKIVDSMIRTFDEVNSGDYVIIQKTFSHRFDIENRLTNKEMDYLNNPVTVTPVPEDMFTSAGYDSIESEHIMNTLTYMDCDIIRKRFDDRFNFFKKLFLSKGVKKCIIWNILDYDNKFQTIHNATNGKIHDTHWSFEGHRNFANKMIDMINNPMLDKKII